MDQSVQMACRLLNRLSHVIFAVQVEYIRDEVQSMLIVVDFGLKPSKVETIGQIFFVYLAKVFISSR